MIPNYSSHIKKRYWEHILSVFLVFRIYRKFFKFLCFDGTFSIPQKPAAFSFPPFLHHVAACFLRARMRGDWFTDCRDYEPVTKNELWVVRSIRPLFQMLCVHLFVSHSASTFTSQRRTCFVFVCSIYRDPPVYLLHPAWSALVVLRVPESRTQTSRAWTPLTLCVTGSTGLLRWLWGLYAILASTFSRRLGH